MNILLTVLINGKMTAQDLANKFEVSKRSIYRYVNALSMSGIPIISESGRKGGVYIAPEFEIRNMFLSTYELRLVYKLLEERNDECCANLRRKIEYINKKYYPRF